LLEPTAVEKWCWYLESHPERAFVKGHTVQFGASECLWSRCFHEGRAFLKQNLVNPTAAVRKEVHAAVQGYDEADRGGLMDWDFWLRCANAGFWGGTVPEYLDWYRRRPSHHDLWADFDDGTRQRAYGRRLRHKYPRLWNGGFPEPSARDLGPQSFLDELPCENRLQPGKRRILLLTAWMCLGGADRFNLDLLQQMTKRGWQVTIAATLEGEHDWLAEYARYTPDCFILHHFLSPRDYPRFLRYLIHSRQVDAVLITHSELGYELLPYLRAHAPHVTYVDYCHIEEEAWKAGGYPRMAAESQPMLDLNIVSSHHLKGWMTRHGADPDRIRVCTTNVDTDLWRPDAAERVAVRRELGVDESTPLVLFAGRLHPQKQPAVLAETLWHLSRENLPFVAVLAGDGPERPWLEAWLMKRGLQHRVRLLGAVPNPRLQRLMRAADVFFLPSQWEGIALTFFEAMASGLPVVGADVGGQRELVTPECGVLIPRSTEKAEARRYAEVLAELLRNPVRRRALGEAGRKRTADFFRLEEMGNGMRALLDEADRLRQCHPRPGVPLGMARQCARQAAECIRLSQWCAQLWTGRDGGGLRFRTYRTIARLASPAYRFAGRRGWTWFFSLGDRVKSKLFSVRPS